MGRVQFDEAGHTGGMAIVTRGVVVLWFIIKHHGLSQPVHFPWSTGILEGCVDGVRQQSHLIIKPLHKVGVATAEKADRHDTQTEAAIVSPEKTCSVLNLWAKFFPEKVIEPILIPNLVIRVE